ncbi:hypothetical protein CC2G_000042 [Coprinopsis cinerea AmutBmut pab1-1]|nr:hypothetical protein CC2G_000042 [Coprinopsis cinerea AmutBmut pab1-1]
MRMIKITVLGMERGKELKTQCPKNHSRELKLTYLSPRYIGLTSTSQLASWQYPSSVLHLDAARELLPSLFPSHALFALLFTLAGSTWVVHSGLGPTPIAYNRSGFLL